MFHYVRDPNEIYKRSFDAVRAETDLSGVPADAQGLAVRLVHACGMPDIVPDMAISPGAVAAGEQALAGGAPVFADVEMVRAGIIAEAMPNRNEVICTLGDVAPSARLTRSAAAVDLWQPRLDGAVVAIGNAPTALYRLLELMAKGARPAFIAAFPVGFIGAAESKEALIAHAGAVPYVTLRGRRGGSGLAAAAINAVAMGMP